MQLRGLQAKPELNGQRGVVTAFDAYSGRCIVQLEAWLEGRLEGNRGPYKIKAENILRI